MYDRRQTQDFPTIFPSTIGSDGVGTVTSTSFIFDTNTPAPRTTTQSTTAATTTTYTTTSAAAITTHAAAAKSGSSNLGVLIPAVVVPIAVVGLISFALFWWIMRRKAKQALAKEPEFVMEKRRNVRKHSRDDSTHSSSSTRKLVSKGSHGDGINKEAAVDVKEIRRSSMELFHDRRDINNGLGIGVAKSPDHTPSHSRQNSAQDQNPSGPPAKAPVAVRNFSRGPSRPSTATQDREQGSSQYARDRSTSSPGSRPPIHAAGRSESRDAPYGRPPPPPLADRPDPRRPLPNLGAGAHMTPSKDSARGLAAGSYSTRGASDSRHGTRPSQGAAPGQDRSRGNSGRNKSGNPPPAIETKHDGTVQKGASLSPPTPTGAYNGASPISQYSPIIKGQSKLGTSPPEGLSTLDVPALNKESPSTPPMGAFTEENMRIARLADSSRLGFYKDMNSKHAPPTISTTTDESTVDQPNPSPRLPPPATRDAPPLNFPPPPPPPADSPTVPHHSRRADSFVNDRRSMRSLVSRLSDDEYVDMEVDAKSDVSSLDERERWDMEREGRALTGATGNANNTTNGYTGLATSSSQRPPLLQSPGSVDTGSQYSLGRY